MSQEKLSFEDIHKQLLIKSQVTSINLCFTGTPVTIRQLKVKEKKEFIKVTESNNDKLIEKAIDDLIEKVATYEDSEPVIGSKLINQEREQLLFEIRKISSNDTEFTLDHACEKCQHVDSVKVPYSSIVTTNFDTTYDISVELNSDKKLIIEPLTRNETVEVEKYIEDNKLTADVEVNHVYIASTIKRVKIDIDGTIHNVELTLKDKLKLLDSLPSTIFDKISNNFKKLPKYGTFFNYDHKCSKCEHEHKNQEVSVISFFIN